MKRVVPLILAVINVLGLVGCTGTIFTTAEYRTYQTFAGKHNAGMEKQTIRNLSEHTVCRSGKFPGDSFDKSQYRMGL